jgi:Tat protein translocase TatC
MTFLEHLEELRKRLLRCAIAVLGGMIVCWFFREEFRAFLEAPLYEAWSQVDGLPPPKPLHFAGLIEPFVAYLKLSAVGGIFIASPVILYQLWRFVSPGLYPRERKVAAPFVIVSTLLFVGGSAMAYTLVFPIGFRFFLDFAAGRDADVVEAQIDVAEVMPAEKPALEPAESGPPDAGARAAAPVDGGVDAGVDFAADAGLDGGVDGGVAETVADGGVAEMFVDGGVVRMFVDGGVLVVETLEEPGRGPPDEVADEDARPKADPADGGVAAVEIQAGDEGEEASFYDWVLQRILRQGCRELELEAELGRITLRLDWDEEGCGPVPAILGLKRGGEELEVEWSEDRESRPGHVLLVAFDHPPQVGAQAYELRLSTGQVAEGQLAPMLMVKDYLSFAVRLLLAFGLVFELPILITFLAFAGIVNYKQLLKFSRWFIVLAVVFSAMLTPPDVITQILLAAPLVILYFISVLVAYIVGERPGPDET